MSAVDPGAGTEAPEYPKLPPVTEIGMASLALILAGAIYMVISLPEKVSLAPAIVLLVLSVALIGVNLVLLSRAKGFAVGAVLPDRALHARGLRDRGRSDRVTSSFTTISAAAHWWC